MRRIMANTLSPDVDVAASFCSHLATWRTRSWSMPSTTAPERRPANAVSYRATIRRASSRTAGRSVELDGQVGDAPGGDVGGDVDLAAADDAELDDAAPGGRVEPRVGG